MSLAIIERISSMLAAPLSRLRREETGAVGWLVIGIIIGAIGIVVLIVKLLIPGE